MKGEKRGLRRFFFEPTYIYCTDMKGTRSSNTESKICGTLYELSVANYRSRTQFGENSAYHKIDILNQIINIGPYIGFGYKMNFILK